MQTWKTTVTTLALAATLLACGSRTELTRDEQRYDRVDWENRYRAYASRCRQAGGHMLIRAVSRIARHDLPRRSDGYRCSLSVGPVPRD
ncbi:MAG: hypothetical protein AAF417_10590 [Pseudomonadota bacterium]